MESADPKNRDRDLRPHDFAARGLNERCRVVKLRVAVDLLQKPRRVQVHRLLGLKNVRRKQLEEASLLVRCKALKIREAFCEQLRHVGLRKSVQDAALAVTVKYRTETLGS